MRILVTGSGGFIGGILCRYLTGQGHEVVKFSGDLTIMDQDQICDQVQGAEAIVHCANVYDKDSTPWMSIMVNAEGTLKMVQAALEMDVKRFIYMSTCHVYGDMTGIIDEKTVPRPKSHYAITHRMAEDYVLAAHDKGDLVGIVLRVSNSFGAPAQDSHNAYMPIVNAMCKSAHDSKSIRLVPAAAQERDFVPVGDVCRAISHFLRLEPEKCLDGLFNVGGERTMAIWEMGQDIALKKGAKLIFDDNGFEWEPQARVHRLMYRIDKLKSTGFLPIYRHERHIDDIFRTLERGTYAGSVC